MRCIPRMLLVLAIASPAWAAANNLAGQVPVQEPAVSTPVPNIHAPGAPTVTTPSLPSPYQNPAQRPTVADPATAPSTGTTATAPFTGTTATAPTGTQTAPTVSAPRTTGGYTYYPTRTRYGWYRWSVPNYTYSYTSMNASPTPVTAGPTYYYVPVQRRGLFGMFQRRYRLVSPTTVYYTPTTNIVPPVATSTVPAGAQPPVYTPTTYTVPTGAAPASAAPAGTTPSEIAPPAAIAPESARPAAPAPETTPPATPAPESPRPATPAPESPAPPATAPADAAPARTIPPPPPIVPKVNRSGL
jgi:hypothetical protein